MKNLKTNLRLHGWQTLPARRAHFDTSGDGSLMTLEDVRKKYPESKAGDAYEAVWKRFFPEEKSDGRLRDRSLAPPQIMAMLGMTKFYISHDA